MFSIYRMKVTTPTPISTYKKTLITERIITFNKTRNKMYFLFGSLFIAAAGFAAYLKSKKSLYHITLEAIAELRYNVLGARAVLADLLEARQNKIDLPMKSGKIALVTGGSRGIGSEVVKMLLQCDMEVIIACRTPAAGDKLIRLLRESGITKGSAKVYELDNNSLESVRKFAESVKKDYRKIDILINNAGIMFVPYKETVDGFEQQWGVNYLSHFLLTSLLIPLLKNASTEKESSRIVSVASCAYILGTINFEDVNHKKLFISPIAYAQSKLAQIMFTKSIQKLLNEKGFNIKAYAVHPGVVNTELFNETPLKKWGQWLMNLCFKNIEQGATPIIYAAVSTEIDGKGGIYISNCLKKTTTAEANDTEKCQRLFNLSLEQTGLKEFV